MNCRRCTYLGAYAITFILTKISNGQTTLLLTEKNGDKFFSAHHVFTSLHHRILFFCSKSKEGK